MLDLVIQMVSLQGLHYKIHWTRHSPDFRQGCRVVASLPHALADLDKKRRRSMCAFLSSAVRRRTFAWVDSVVTADEKHFLYDNTVRRKRMVDFYALVKPRPKHPDHDKNKFLVIERQWPGLLEIGFNRFCGGLGQAPHLEKMSEILRKRRPRRRKFSWITPGTLGKVGRTRRTQEQEHIHHAYPGSRSMTIMLSGDFSLFPPEQSSVIGRRSKAQSIISCCPSLLGSSITEFGLFRRNGNM